MSLSFAELREGMTARAVYRIDAGAHDALVRIFGDANSLHIDDEVARALGFRGRVMHGAILQCFLSNFVGMRFPAGQAMLLSTSLEYANASYLEDEIELEAEVAQKVESQSVVVLRLRFMNRTQGHVAARGRSLVRVGPVGSP